MDRTWRLSLWPLVLVGGGIFLVAILAVVLLEDRMGPTPSGDVGARVTVVIYGHSAEVWDIAFSKDPQQKYIFLADGKNEKVYIMLRDTLEIVSSFGDGGRQPGQFFAVHSIAIDSKGNLFTTETYEGRRLQKFVYKGIANVPRDQGVVWPGK